MASVQFAPRPTSMIGAGLKGAPPLSNVSSEQLTSQRISAERELISENTAVAAPIGSSHSEWQSTLLRKDNALSTTLAAAISRHAVPFDFFAPWSRDVVCFGGGDMFPSSGGGEIGKDGGWGQGAM